MTSLGESRAPAPATRGGKASTASAATAMRGTACRPRAWRGCRSACTAWRLDDVGSLLTGADDGTLQAWVLDDRNLPHPHRELIGHTQCLTALCFLDPWPLLASADASVSGVGRLLTEGSVDSSVFEDGVRLVAEATETMRIETTMRLRGTRKMP